MKLQICGMNNTIDAGPDNFGCSIFLKGCNLRCPYCMNASLVNGKCETDIKLDDVYDFVKKDKSDWVFISGGEPTYAYSEDILPMIINFYKMGKKIGISTNGTDPDTLNELLSWVNYVAMDLKGDIKTYEKISGVAGGKVFMKVIESWNLLRDYDGDYEIRTTAYPHFVDMNIVCFMSDFFIQDEKWVFQVYRPTNDMLEEVYDESNYAEYTNSIADYAKSICKANVSVRHV